MLKVAVVGLGKLGSVIAAATAQVFADSAGDQLELFIRSDSIASAELAETYGLQTYTDLTKLADCDLIFLCFKPQNLAEFAASIAQQSINLSDKTIISVLAGIDTENIGLMLNAKSVIRAMPNLAMTVGAGVTGIYQTPTVKLADYNFVCLIFSGVSQLYHYTQEKLIDQLLAVSASGMGFIYYLLEAMQQSAESLGFSKDDAQNLIVQTTAGALAYQQASGKSFSQLIQDISSAGGTTEAGIEILKQAHLTEALRAAGQEALNRCAELNQK